MDNTSNTNYSCQRFIKMEALRFKLDLDITDKVCTTCPFNMLPTRK